MNKKELLKIVENLNIWKSGDVRAPHKPLTILYALGRYYQDQVSILPYELVRDDIAMLLKEFGPKRKAYYPEQPFVRLENDGLWTLNQAVKREQIRNRWLCENEITGGFTDEVLTLISEDPNIIYDIAHQILFEHFPSTYHEDLLASVGLENRPFQSEVVEVIRHIKPRDPKFRKNILEVYEGSCAVCGYNIHYNKKLVGVEAAHIKWHEAGGPDVCENGLALCSMHHKLFDYGAFTVDNSLKIHISEFVSGSSGVDEWLGQFDGKKIREPKSYKYLPNDQYVDWHLREVYKG